jgi:ATP-dependent DNA helicase 2 subunit 2
MADKEATVYIIDLGKSMGKKRHGREETDLDLAVRYVWERISNTTFTGRKMSHIGVIGLRTEETNNSMSPDEYNNISVLLDPPQQVQMPEIRQLKSHFRLNDCVEGDAISAIIIAVDMIEKHCKKLKYVRRIVLVTDARGPIDGEDNPEIAKQIEKQGIELTVVCSDFDDPSAGFKEENKDPGKEHNEELLKELASSCNGKVLNMSKALEDMEIPTIKIVRAVASFKGQLTLGDTNKYDNASISIDVERYPRVMVTRAISAKLTVSKTGFGGAMDLDVTQSTATVHDDGGENGVSAVKRSRAYTIGDPDAPTGKREVEKEDLERGFEYGRTAVHMGTSDENVVKLETNQGLQIVGFVNAQKVR